MTIIENAIGELRRGNFVLVHDSSNREDEVDFVIGAEFVNAKHVAKMREYGGGLICLAIGKEIAGKLSLPFMSDILNHSRREYPLLTYLKSTDIPYDEKSSFSITINHRKTFTGISDEDRALTISKVGEFCKNLPPENIMEKFGKEFRSPGHVHLLLSSGLETRRGHTELSTTLLKIAGLSPVSVVCEMLDSETHKSLSKDKAEDYAKENNLIFLEGNKIKRAYLSSKN